MDKKKLLWLYARQPSKVLNDLNARRQLGMFRESQPTSSRHANHYAARRLINYALQVHSRRPTHFLVAEQSHTLMAGSQKCLQNHSRRVLGIASTFWASYTFSGSRAWSYLITYAVTTWPAAGQGLTWTKYPGVRNFHRISTERFFHDCV